MRFELPREAVEEALINALVHRNWRLSASVEVRLFADRVEIWTPGALPEGITIPQLYETHSSYPVWSYRKGATTMDKIISGRVELELDKAGRMLLPQSWFEAVGRDRYVFVMPDPTEKCLRLVPASNMEARLAKMRERAIIDPAMNRALQVIGENAEQIEVDNEGGVGISEKLLAFAGITRQFVMVGGEWCTQLWSPEELSCKEAK